MTIKRRGNPLLGFESRKQVEKRAKTWVNYGKLWQAERLYGPHYVDKSNDLLELSGEFDSILLELDQIDRPNYWR